MIYDLLLRQATHGSQFQNTVSVVQYLSPACRAARKPVAHNLPAAQILHAVNDNDVNKCKMGYHVPLGFIGVFILLFPALFAIISTGFSDVLLDTILPSFFFGFVIANQYLYNISVIIVCLPYIALVSYLVWLFVIFNPSKRRVKKLQTRSEAQR